MPKLNRRFFLQLTGAAGLAPAVPALPARAAATAKATAPTAKLLWASLYAKAGSQAKLAGVAQSLGISGHAARGISAKLAASHIIARPTLTPTKPKSKFDLRKFLTEDPDDPPKAPAQEKTQPPVDD